MKDNKLFYIANARLPTEKAHGMQIMKSCEALARAGLNVELLVPRRKNPMQGNPYEYYSVEKDFTITMLPALDTVRFGKLGFLLELFSFLAAARLYTLGKHGVIYTRETAAGLFFPAFALETHIFPASMNAFRRAVFRRAGAHFVLTSFIKRELMRIGVPEERIAIAPDAVDLSLFGVPFSRESARKTLRLPSDKKIALYAGSFFLYDWKGVDVFLEAAKAFGDEFSFVLVGGNAQEVREAQNAWGGSNTLFLGYQPPKSIPAYLKAADILVIPNKKGSTASEHYTSPLKLFEYMASERPIVASRLPSLEEVVNERDVAFFEPNSAKDLARALRLVMGDTALAESLAQSARRKVEAYTWDTRMKNISDALRAPH
ncbi:MAG: hypothetical protein A2W52_01670 [Candidatus Taylorbacteria bacterium RIFCSPHIGHO2_02_49_25]|uniref:Glycosyl transferase family 1 domain-containing protein n=1 Tax=Candidatus Taylorbacteria bacterium RIFCSPHIGHO2_02_49_25 TaxID=1802305 RepID=A0A1G2MDL6_9BACT|nr:MAG: Glycosyl transferase group 1 [Parcubacteria group bacterium GW2011_GWF2_50_9]OHA19158.1 MAG: hypothetical protein A2759_00510 [Candidatus Taylorbacteria bacterium RIFCSPHIGHO2_01_FULL_49_60]OHA21101.1 MAG: hypothetical protein A2W52_01670 [Candidatus Taylorbacteria bacterium RIFCSPHIGHO2_02_49_25]OHA35929.1 MAG: hypothetical protein A3B27_01775 [Candidatus Taylorbacteria bacterium RIFCSPLOWO2_01_FULL_50_130]OHA37312.1 MAG: hypothetical protein A2W65_03515 [Candidatus Taylorbacteria bact